MKKTSIIIIVPVIALVLVVVIALSWKLYATPSGSRAAAPSIVQYGLPSAAGGMPAKGFSASSATSQSDLTKDLNAVTDDGGAKDLQDLQTSASGL